jgi:hypothetical protein
LEQRKTDHVPTGVTDKEEAPAPVPEKKKDTFDMFSESPEISENTELRPIAMVTEATDDSEGYYCN